MKKEKRKLHFQFLINQVWQVFASKLLPLPESRNVVHPVWQTCLGWEECHPVSSSGEGFAELEEVKDNYLLSCASMSTSLIRPSIDELGVPSEPWSRVHDRNQKKFSVQVPTINYLKINFGAPSM